MTKRMGVIVLVAIILALCTGTAGAYQLLVKEVTVIDDNATYAYKTTKLTVQEFLEEKEIILGDVDQINAAYTDSIEQGMEIIIKRAVPVMIRVDGMTIEVKTCLKTVRELIDAQKITINKQDIVNVHMMDTIQAGMMIDIQTYREEERVEEEEILFETEVRHTAKLDKDEINVIQSGEMGIKQKTLKVVYIGGKEANREVISEEVVKEPVKAVIEEGTTRVLKTARGTYRYSKVITMSATAYTASYKDTGKNPGDPGFGITASGMKARVGVVAVDPTVIPLGTRLYIEGYGPAIAGDTGGAIKGNKVDLYFDTRAEVERFGRQNRKVYILLP